MSSIERSLRYAYGGDSYILVVVAEEMSLQTNLHTMALASAVEALELSGVHEVCPGNASYLVHFDPDVIDVEALIAALRNVEDAAERLVKVPSCLVEIPIWFDDPFTRENTLTYADRHQDPSVSNLEYVARLNDMSPDELIDAYCRVPWWVTMVGFTPGTAWTLQMVPREQMIQAPKWRSPRPFTPERCLGHGGVFAGIDPVDEPSGYQQLGRTPIPIYDPEGRVPALEESVLARPADRWSFRSIDGDEYEDIRRAVEGGSYRYRIVPQEFLIDRYELEGAAYLGELAEEAADALG